MNQRMLLTVAASLTAFVLVVIGSLASYMTIVPASQPIQTSETPTVTPVVLDPTTEAQIKEREAAYQQALNEANTRIEQANRQVATANAQLAQAQTAQATTQTSAAQPAPYAISAEQAQAIALSLSSGAQLSKTPELVNYQGTAAYEVVLDRGTVYIHAQTGAIVAQTLNNVVSNQRAAPATSSEFITPQQAADAAITYRGGGQVLSIDPRRNRNIYFYQVIMDDGSEIFVDARSGQVIYATIQGAQGGEENHDSDGDHDDDDHDD